MAELTKPRDSILINKTATQGFDAGAKSKKKKEIAMAAHAWDAAWCFRLHNLPSDQEDEAVLVKTHQQDHDAR